MEIDFPHFAILTTHICLLSFLAFFSHFFEVVIYNIFLINSAGFIIIDLVSKISPDWEVESIKLISNLWKVTDKHTSMYK